jgi:GNAT superfamily N-acetyltransferase
MIETTVTYLELSNRPEPRPGALPEGFAVERVPAPDVGFYRDLYRRVGDPGLWFERKKLDDAELAAVIRDPQVEILVLRQKRAAVGLAELDFRTPPDVELAYFGLVPELIGAGLGGPFFERVLDAAFARRPERFWLHSCTLDHPRALDFYLAQGFTVFKTEQHAVPDPRGEPWWGR